REVKSQDVDSPLAQRRGHAAQVVGGGLLGQQVAKAVDRVERSVGLAAKLEVAHIGDKGGRRKAVSRQTCVAELDGVGIQVETADVVPLLGEAVEEPPRAARGLEQALHLAGGVPLKTGSEEIELRLPIRSEDQVVVARIVVDVAADELGHARMMAVRGQ